MEFELCTESSNLGSGSVLHQRDPQAPKPRQLRVIGYQSYTFNPHEVNYDTTDKEALAAIKALKYFRSYLEGRKVVLHTDHQALLSLMTDKEPKGRRARWIIRESLQLSLPLPFLQNLKMTGRTDRRSQQEQYLMTSYRQLIEDTTALPGFYDVVEEVSIKFKSAPQDTLRRKIWEKLLASGVDPKNMIQNGMSKVSVPELSRKTFYNMNRNHNVVMASTLAINLLKSVMCGFSSEEELWRLVIFSDDSEGEQLLGWAVSRHISTQTSRYYMPRLMPRWMFESSVILEFYKWATGESLMGHTLSGASKKHMYEQRLACSDDYSPGENIHVRAIGLKYFGSFFALVLLLFFIAQISHMYHVLFARKTRTFALDDFHSKKLAFDPSVRN